MKTKIIKSWAIIGNDDKIIPFNIPIGKGVLFAGIFVKKEQAKQWLKVGMRQGFKKGFRGRLEEVEIRRQIQEEIEKMVDIEDTKNSGTKENAGKGFLE